MTVAIDRKPKTETSRPSGKNPLRSRHGLELEWALVPLTIAIVTVLAFGLRWLL